jgi:hypothetical protein
VKHKVKSSGIVKVFNINDKRVNCFHEDKILYCVRDGYRFYWCNDCKNLVREEISCSEKEIKRGDGNEK